MFCLAGICGEAPVHPFSAEALDSQQAAFNAARKLSANFMRVVRDTCNPGPNAIGGGNITQGLARVDPSEDAVVRAMLSAVCCRLLGKECAPPSKSDAAVWFKAARFVGNRIQSSAGECPGRDPDMTPAEATEMRNVLGQIEAASKLTFNFETVVKDITNNTTSGVYEDDKSQPDLARVDPRNKALVEAMLRDVCARLCGKPSTLPKEGEQAVWADAACFFGQRVQSPDTMLVDCKNTDRPADMSLAAAQQLRAVLAKMEASIRLHSNKAAVCADITNANPISQKGLQRVAPQQKAAVDKMLQALVAQLLDQSVNTEPSSPSEGKVWADAATYLSARIQSSSEECPGRPADMSPAAGMMMRRVLAQFEAFGKLYSNKQTVVQDIINPSPQTQPELKRVESKYKAAVESMVDEVCARLIGKRNKEPEPGVAQVWTDAATYLHGRIQSSARQCPGRAPDMSRDAAMAMRKVLARINSKREAISGAVEAAHALMSNRDRVVKDIFNPGRENIDGKELTQIDLVRVSLSKENIECVHIMISDVCCSLLGSTNPNPSIGKEPAVWKAAAKYLVGRIQGDPNECRGREPDMSASAAKALKQVLSAM